MGVGVVGVESDDDDDEDKEVRKALVALGDVLMTERMAVAADAK